MPSSLQMDRPCLDHPSQWIHRDQWSSCLLQVKLLKHSNTQFQRVYLRMAIHKLPRLSTYLAHKATHFLKSLPFVKTGQTQFPCTNPDRRRLYQLLILSLLRPCRSILPNNISSHSTNKFHYKSMGTAILSMVRYIIAIHPFQVKHPRVHHYPKYLKGPFMLNPSSQIHTSNKLHNKTSMLSHIPS